jgi:hypothetical protein
VIKRLIVVANIARPYTVDAGGAFFGCPDELDRHQHGDGRQAGHRQGEGKRMGSLGFEANEFESDARKTTVQHGVCEVLFEYLFKDAQHGRGLIEEMTVDRFWGECD